MLVLNAQHEFRGSDSYGKETGLNSALKCIAEDNEGFFWVGTWDGLFRFDGAQARRIFYKTVENEDFGLISDLDFEAATNSLWICSDRGVCRYDLNTKEFEHFNPEDFFSKSEVDKGNVCIFQDRQGEWWGDFNAKGLTRFLHDDKRVERFVVPESQLQGAGIYGLANTVLTVTQDAHQDSIIWAGTRCGLIRVNKVGKSLQYFQYNHPDAKLTEVSNAMISLLSHDNGRLYIGTWNGGLLEFNPATQLFRQYFTAPNGFDKHKPTNQVYTLLKDGPNSLWIGCSTGICRFSIPETRFTLIKKDASLHYRDKQGNFWTFWDGLERYDRFKNQLPVIPLSPGQVKRFVAETDSKEIYIKKYGQPGVLAFDPADQKIRGLPFYGKNKLTTDGNVLVFTAMGLLANDMERLYLLPRGGESFAPLGYSLPANAGWFSAKSLPDGGAVVSGDRGYLIHFNPGEIVPEVYPPAVVGGEATRLQDGLIASAIDQWGRVWLRASGGFSIFDPSKRQFHRFPYQNAPDKNFTDIRGFHADNKGRMWCIGPEDLGWLDQAHPEEGIQKRYNLANGFDFSGIEVLRVDKKGLVWFTCRKGLIQFSPETETYRAYPLACNLIDFLPNGNLAISFVDGFSVVDPDSLRADTIPPRPYAAWFKVLDKEKPLLGSLLSPKEIWLAPHENFISIGFSALGFSNPGDYQFAYQLKGINEDWVNADPDNPVAAYTALGGGDYVFRLKVRDANGHWSIRSYELRIHIATPWYLTWPAWLLYAGLTALAARWWLRSRDRQLLVQQKLREEQREAERLKELDNFRNRFFTNITHEFRTPLTVILGMASELETETKTEQSAAGLLSKIQHSSSLIRRNGQRLLDLVNQMLALARLDAGSLPVQMVRGDVMNHLRILAEAFHSYAVSQKIGLQFHAAPDHFEMDFDPELLQRIVSNLVSNGLKFTEEYGNVLVNAKVVIAQGQGEQLLLEVSDTGSGISQEQIPHIFDRFYQGDSTPLRGEESSGIGLALVKEIVSLLHGRIEVESEVERGSTFRVWLPVTRRAETEAGNGSDSSIGFIPESLVNGIEERLEMSKPLALVVEDNADVLDYIRACLLPEWEVLTARNGTAGLSLAQEELPDVIISDVMMPGMDGFALTEALKSDLRTSHIPILLLTAKSTRADLLEGLSKGADDYLVKPFDKAELMFRLRNFHLQQLRWQNRPVEPEAPDPLPDSERAFLQKVDAAIEAHLDETNFKSEHLARAVTLSRVQLHRKLTALAGISTGLYIRRYRLLRAKNFLTTTDLTVSEVAWKVGFENLSWFSQAYREEFGESPRDSRKQ